MFDWLWKKRPVVNQVTIGVKELEQVRNLLFPEYKTEQLPTGELFHVDHSVDTNLEAVIYDLEDGTNDPTARKTLRAIADKLFKARELLYVQQEMKPGIQHIVFAQEISDEDK